MTDEEWDKKCREEKYSWMSDNQWECYTMLCDLVGGSHHIYGGKIQPAGNGILINIRNHGWSTFDFNLLTRAVIMAHDRMIRLEINPSGPGLLKLIFHKRQGREGMMHERHPTIEQAIIDCREWRG